MSVAVELDLDVVKVPDWASDHFPPADPDEGFRSYWARMGVPAERIDAAFDGLTERTIDLAHHRIALYVKEVCAQSFEKYVAARLSRYRPGRRL